MQPFRLSEKACLGNEPVENDASLIAKPLGMPLHAEHRLVLHTLHGLHDTVVSPRNGTEQAAGTVYRLVVKGVYLQAGGMVQVMEKGVFVECDGVCLLVTVLLLAVADSVLAAPFLYIRDVLSHMSAQGNCHCLHSAAYSEHGHLAV